MKARKKKELARAKRRAEMERLKAADMLMRSAPPMPPERDYYHRELDMIEWAACERWLNEQLKEARNDNENHRGH